VDDLTHFLWLVLGRREVVFLRSVLRSVRTTPRTLEHISQAHWMLVERGSPFASDDEDVSRRRVASNLMRVPGVQVGLGGPWSREGLP